MVLIKVTSSMGGRLKMPTLLFNDIIIWNISNCVELHNDTKILVFFKIDCPKEILNLSPTMLSFVASLSKYDVI